MFLWIKKPMLFNNYMPCVTFRWGAGPDYGYLHDLCSTLNAVRAIQSRKKESARHVARLGYKRSACMILVVNLT